MGGRGAHVCEEGACVRRACVRRARLGLLVLRLKAHQLVHVLKGLRELLEGLARLRAAEEGLSIAWLLRDRRVTVGHTLLVLPKLELGQRSVAMQRRDLGGLLTRLERAAVAVTGRLQSAGLEVVVPQNLLLGDAHRSRQTRRRRAVKKFRASARAPAVEEDIYLRNAGPTPNVHSPLTSDSPLSPTWLLINTVYPCRAAAPTLRPSRRPLGVPASRRESRAGGGWKDLEGSEKTRGQLNGCAPDLNVSAFHPTDACVCAPVQVALNLASASSRHVCLTQIRTSCRSCLARRASGQPPSIPCPKLYSAIAPGWS